MDLAELRKTAVAKPQVAKLKMLGEGLKVGVVLGRRVLVKPVIPFTDADRVEKEGRLIIPEQVKKDNTPLPSTGVIVQLGTQVKEEELQEGTGVCFSKFGGTQFVFDKEDYLILNVDEIMCTFMLEQEGVIEGVAGA